MIVRSGVTVSCPSGSKEKGLTLSCKSYGSPSLVFISDIMQHCVIRRVRPTNSKLTVVCVANNDLLIRCHLVFEPKNSGSKEKGLTLSVQVLMAPRTGHRQATVCYPVTSCNIALFVVSDRRIAN